MAISERAFRKAQDRTNEKRDGPVAVAARLERGRRLIAVELDNGIEIRFPADRAEGLAGAAAAVLQEIEITPSGLGLHWPKLDADLYLPALLAGIFGSRRWIAAQLGASGGRSRSASKAAAARVNGQRGGRPRKLAAG